MGYKILHKRSSVDGKVPSADQLEAGEIAINNFAGNEFISILNSEGEVVSHSLSDKLDDAKDALNKHQARNDNPHGVTKEQVGLGNVDNTADLEKPLSTAQAAALNSKLDNADNGGVVNDLTTNDSQKALSAAQGVALSKKISEMTGGAVAGLEALEQRVSVVEEEISTCTSYIDDILDPKASELLALTV